MADSHDNESGLKVYSASDVWPEWSHDLKDSSLETKLNRRDQLTEILGNAPLDPRNYFARAECYKILGYPDLAAGDVHKALELVETGLDDTYSDYPPEIWDKDQEDFVSYDSENHEEELLPLRIRCFILLSQCCSLSGCFQDALHYLKQAEKVDDTNQFKDLRTEAWNELVKHYQDLPSTRSKVSIDELDTATGLPNSGTVRREIYSWNDHEPDRSSPEVLNILNERLAAVAPHVEARSTALPVLHVPEADEKNADTNTEEVSIQLGLFAKDQLSPGMKILHEPSLLNACRTLHSPLCDCCQSPLPSLSSENPPIPCPNCSDTVFCSEACSDLAQEKYHPAVCDNEDGLEEIGRDSNSQNPSDDLYLLLLARVIAMAETQDCHPLDLPEIKYIWGDFSSPNSTTSLPFSITHAIDLPHRILTAMAISPFESLLRYDTWVFQTLYAKFRGVASAKQSTWDGKPEVAAVHPLWCLANHSCDPNIRWEWPAPAKESSDQVQSPDEEQIGSGIVMTVRTQAERALWGDDSKEKSEWKGIAAGEEILNHYCDIRLPVKERREWAMGALGGACMCERCIWEASQS